MERERGSCKEDTKTVGILIMQNKSLKWQMEVGWEGEGLKRSRTKNKGLEWLIQLCGLRLKTYV